jgi:hypothetical protein
MLSSALLGAARRAIPIKSLTQFAHGYCVEYADVFGVPFDFTAKPVVAPPQPPRIRQSPKRAPKLPRRQARTQPLSSWSVHDLRRTVAIGLQRLGVRLEVTEAVLNHISGSRGVRRGVSEARLGNRKTRCSRWLGVSRSFSC